MTVLVPKQVAAIVHVIDISYNYESHTHSNTHTMPLQTVQDLFKIQKGVTGQSCSYSDGYLGNPQNVTR